MTKNLTGDMNIEYSEFVWLDEQHELSLDELATLSGLTQQELHLLVDNGALVPNNPDAKSWHFSSHCIVSIRTLSKLKQDFELEPSAFALILVFLERIRKLEMQLQRLK
jgi:chaperone modulatory protein CbpM